MPSLLLCFGTLLCSVAAGESACLGQAALAESLADLLRRRWPGDAASRQLAESLDTHSDRVWRLVSSPDRAGDTALRGAMIAQRVALLQAKKMVEPRLSAAERAGFLLRWVADPELDALAGVALKMAQDALMAAPARRPSAL